MNPEIKKMYEDYFDKCFRESSPTQQEHVAWVCNGTNGHHDIDFFEEDVDSLSVGTQLYTTPPQRTWVGLTDDEVYRIAFELEGEQVYRIAFEFEGGHWRKIVDVIEAKLRSKNEN